MSDYQQSLWEKELEAAIDYAVTLSKKLEARGFQTDIDQEYQTFSVFDKDGRYREYPLSLNTLSEVGDDYNL